MTVNIWCITLHYANVVKHRCLTYKLLICIQFRMLAHNLCSHISNLLAMPHHNIAQRSRSAISFNDNVCICFHLLQIPILPASPSLMSLIPIDISSHVALLPFQSVSQCACFSLEGKIV